MYKFYNPNPLGRLNAGDCTISMNNGYSRRGRGYSYDDGKAHMIDKLNNLMMEANDQKDKESIQRLIDQMENN